MYRSEAENRRRLGTGVETRGGVSVRMPGKTKRGIYRAGKVLSGPGAFIHDKAEEALYSEVAEKFLYAVTAVLLSVGALTVSFSPKYGMNPLLAAFLALILFAVCKILIGFVVPAVLYIICSLTAPFAYINERCAGRLSGNAGPAASSGFAPRPGVGIQYFIARERRHGRGGFFQAKYIDG